VNPDRPIDYVIRVSAKAKRVQLKLSIARELEVVVPRNFDLNRIPEILQQKQAWIETATAQLEAQRQSFGVDTSDRLPSSLSLRAIDAEWQIDYQHRRSSNLVAIEAGKNQLILQGDYTDEWTCKVTLQQWLMRKAHDALVPWLQETSNKHNLPFNKAQIKSQKTRWASCSSLKTINLNCKLLFLPPPLVHYVFVHELCHTIHLNHSAQFWALVEDKEPSYKKLNQDLRSAWRYVPIWIEQL
jgi:predicted metal-dependent hydrolase